MESTRPKYYVTARLTASTSVQEFSKIFEGLRGLERLGIIQFRMRPSAERTVPRVLSLVVDDGTGMERSIAIDIADDVAILDPELLEGVDLYFKRSLTIEAPAGGKVRPFGLNNPAIRPGTALAVLGARLRTGRRVRELAADARQLFALPPPRAFERSPDEPAEQLVLFQTRLWEPTPEDPGRDEINNDRVELIRTLRSAFGSQFLGGAIPTPFVRKSYPDIATTLPFSMRAYPRLLRRPLVAVYSRGLLDSLAFKMSEYLAASCCIVGHAPTTILPEPLAAKRNYLPFATPGECVAQCEQLLSQPRAASQMRRANWDYYQRCVEPSAHLLAVLDRSFAG